MQLGINAKPGGVPDDVTIGKVGIAAMAATPTAATAAGALLAMALKNALEADVVVVVVFVVQK